MSDKLTDRLRGKYKIGPDGVYGTRNFVGFIPPICIEAAEKIEELQRVVQMCFEDSCKPSGKISKRTAIELVNHADTKA